MNNSAFYIMQTACSEGILLGGSDMLDKAQIEKSVLYPAFLFLRSKKKSREEGNDMDLLTSKIKPMYFKYLAAAFGSALISSIYGAVDMAMVGQYQGPEGTAALAVVAPVWNIIYSLGLLMGIGGSVLFTMLRGESEQNQKKSNEYFTAAVVGAAVLAAITWLAVIFLMWSCCDCSGRRKHCSRWQGVICFRLSLWCRVSCLRSLCQPFCATMGILPLQRRQCYLAESLMYLEITFLSLC